MTSNLPGPAADLHHIRVALTSLGDALAQGRADLVSAAEAGLQTALRSRSLPDPVVMDVTARRVLREEIVATRAALDRCRRLGASLADVVRVTLTAHGRVGGYDRNGTETIATRIGAVDARG